MIPPEGVKIFTLEKSLTRGTHIRREFHTYPENFKSYSFGKAKRKKESHSF